MSSPPNQLWRKDSIWSAQGLHLHLPLARFGFRAQGWSGPMNGGSLAYASLSDAPRRQGAVSDPQLVRQRRLARPDRAGGPAHRRQPADRTRVVRRAPQAGRRADRFGVARNTVREALGALRALGVIDIRPKVGAVLINRHLEAALDAFSFQMAISVETFRDIQGFRNLIETGLFDLIAPRLTEDDLTALDALTDQMQAAPHRRRLRRRRPRLSRGAGAGRREQDAERRLSHHAAADSAADGNRQGQPRPRSGGHQSSPDRRRPAPPRPAGL